MGLRTGGCAANQGSSLAMDDDLQSAKCLDAVRGRPVAGSRPLYRTIC